MSRPHATAATPSQRLAAAARLERERRIAAHARPDTPIACPSASARSQRAGGLPRLPPAPAASNPAEPPKENSAPVRAWFWIAEEINAPLPAKLRIQDIQGVVERHCKVAHAELISPRRTAKIVRARQIAMFLAKNLTSISMPAIGREFGDRDHTTVLHAVRKIVALQARDQTLAADLEIMRRALTAAPPDADRLVAPGLLERNRRR